MLAVGRIPQEGDHVRRGKVDHSTNKAVARGHGRLERARISGTGIALATSISTSTVDKLQLMAVDVGRGIRSKSQGKSAGCDGFMVRGGRHNMRGGIRVEQ